MRYPRIIAYLPDIAILLMVTVIGVALMLISRLDLALWILLPILLFLIHFWTLKKPDSQPLQSIEPLNNSENQAN